MTVSVEVFDPRHDAVPPGWEEFAREVRLHAPWDYALLGEESRQAPHPLALAVTTVDGRVVAAMVSTVIGLWGARLIEVHNVWMPGMPGWVWAAGLGPRHRRSVLRRMERALCRHAGVRCVGVFYRFVDADVLPLVSGPGRIAQPTLGLSILRNEFSSVDDWVASLRRSRRQSLRRQLRKVERDPDLRVRFGAAREDLDSAELAELFNNHRRRYGTPKPDLRGTVSPRYMSALLRREDVFFLSYHDGSGRLLAFADLLDHPETPVYQHWAALAPEDGGRRHLYFDSYARMVRHAVDNKCEALMAGRGMSDIKESLGMTTEGLWRVAVPRLVVG